MKSHLAAELVWVSLVHHKVNYMESNTKFQRCLDLGNIDYELCVFTSSGVDAWEGGYLKNTCDSATG